MNLKFVLINPSIVELAVGLIITCIGPVEKLVRNVVRRHFPSILGSRTSVELDEGPMPREKKKKHQRGGLSEIDSMKTFGTTVDTGYAAQTPTRSDFAGSRVRVQLPPKLHVLDELEV